MVCSNESWVWLGFDTLLWMFRGTKLNNCMKNTGNRALIIGFRDYKLIFKDLFKQNRSVAIHNRNLQTLFTYIFKTKNGSKPLTMEKVFKSEKFDM